MTRGDFLGDGSAATTAAATQLVDANRAAYDRVEAAGGTLYPVSAFPLDSAGWRKHIGPVYERLWAAKQTYDPQNLLTPGYELFHTSEKEPRA